MPIIWLYCIYTDICIRLYCIHADTCILRVHRYMYTHPKCRFFGYNAYKQIHVYGYTLIPAYYMCVDICIPTHNADPLVILHIQRYMDTFIRNVR